MNIRERSVNFLSWPGFNWKVGNGFRFLKIGSFDH